MLKNISVIATNINPATPIKIVTEGLWKEGVKKFCEDDAEFSANAYKIDIPAVYPKFQLDDQLINFIDIIPSQKSLSILIKPKNTEDMKLMDVKIEKNILKVYYNNLLLLAVNSRLFIKTFSGTYKPSHIVRGFMVKAPEETIIKGMYNDEVRDILGNLGIVLEEVYPGINILKLRDDLEIVKNNSLSISIVNGEDIIARFNDGGRDLIIYEKR